MHLYYNNKNGTIYCYSCYEFSFAKNYQSKIDYSIIDILYNIDYSCFRT